MTSGLAVSACRRSSVASVHNKERRPSAVDVSAASTTASHNKERRPSAIDIAAAMSQQRRPSAVDFHTTTSSHRRPSAIDIAASMSQQRRPSTVNFANVNFAASPSSQRRPSAIDIAAVLSQQRRPSVQPDFPDIATLMNGINKSFARSSFSLPDDNGEISCWLLDTRNLWPGKNIWAAPGAAEAMNLVSAAEQKAIGAKMFIQDARMSLGSALLKRLFISQTLDIPWREVTLGRKGNVKHGKPIAVDALGRMIEGIDFNVSHQAGLVALVGWNGKKKHVYSTRGGIEGSLSPVRNIDPDVMVGVDIVCVHERDDYRTIDTEGLDGWVDIYDFVFSDEERWSMKYDIDYVTMLDGTILSRDDLGRNDRCMARNKSLSCTTAEGKEVTFNSDLLIDAKLRRFYTYFCYKEAYIKLAGEALLAPWLKQLEFFGVRSPKPGNPARCSTHGVWGEEVDDVDVNMHGKEVDDVKMKIQSFEENFMISTAMQGQIKGIKVPAFQSLDLHNDILAYAHKHLTTSPSERNFAEYPRL